MPNKDKPEVLAELPNSVADVSDDPEHRALNRALDEQMARLLAILPPMQREILLLRMVVHMSVDETAQSVGSTPSAVRVAQNRALETLRNALSRPDVPSTSPENETDTPPAPDNQNVVTDTPLTKLAKHRTISPMMEASHEPSSVEVAAAGELAEAIHRRSTAAVQRAGYGYEEALRWVEQTVDEATQLDPDDDANRHAITLATMTHILISGLQPRREDRSALDALTNPYNADTQIAAQARLTAAAEVARSAQNIGHLLAMREIDKGNLSQRTAATALGVSQMTVNRWYRAHKAEQAAEEQQQETDH